LIEGGLEHLWVDSVDQGLEQRLPGMRPEAVKRGVEEGFSRCP
jgi:hypothetical protein